jgi:16S rRNA (uracil1498-N3)-methyltransferase
MHRFYIDDVDGDKAFISDSEQLHHLKAVLRLKVNDEVIVFDSRGNEYLGVITGLDREQAELKVSLVKSSRSRPTKLTVACAIPKGNRMDDIIDYLTQLGVERIIPMQTERVVVKLDNAKAEVRLKRWKKIAQSAAQQSQRSRIPHIEPVTRVENVISNSRNFDLKLIPTLAGERKLIKEVVTKTRPKDIIVLIGPEGDFSPEEIEMALSKGFIPVSLGDTVLRVATAAIAVAGYLKFALGE